MLRDARYFRVTRHICADDMSKVRLKDVDESLDFQYKSDELVICDAEHGPKYLELKI